VCEDAKRDANRYYKMRRAGKTKPGVVDSLPTRRRIQAWMAVEWTTADIARWLGYQSPQAVTYLLSTPRVLASTAEKVTREFSARSLQVPPDTPRSRRCRLLAQRKGFAPELAWDNIDDLSERPSLGTRYAKRGDEVDQACVSEAMAGRRPFKDLTRAEARLVVRRLVEQRFWSDARIAEWLRTTDRTVLRTRKAAGIEAVPVTRQLDAA
jgi:hypothetical protein